MVHVLLVKVDRNIPVTLYLTEVPVQFSSSFVSVQDMRKWKCAYSVELGIFMQRA